MDLPPTIDHPGIETTLLRVMIQIEIEITHQEGWTRAAQMTLNDRELGLAERNPILTTALQMGHGGVERARGRVQLGQEKFAIAPRR